MKTIFSLLFCVIVMTTASAWAEEPIRVASVLAEARTVELKPKTDIQFRKISLAQGLSQTRVGKIIQDDQGYIWLGPQHGANRYDGYNFRVFTHDRDNPGSLSGVYIYSLFKDRNGTVWIGTDQLLDAFDETTGQFRHYTLDETTPTVLHISEDKHGFLWLSTSQGLYRLNPNGGHVERFGHVEGDETGLSTDDIKSTGIDSKGVFWVATGNGMEAFDPDTKKVNLRIPLRIEAREFEFLEDSHGLFWIFFGSGSGLALYDRDSNTLQKLSFKNADDGLSGIYRMIESKNGDLWFATMGAGLLRFNRSDFSFDQYVNDPTDPQSLTENRVIELYEDNQGNIWAGLHSNPPNVFSPEPRPFKKVWPAPGQVNKLGEKFVNTILEDRDGIVWLGVGGGLHRVDRNGNVTAVDLLGENKSVEILSIKQSANGVLWIGTIGSGLISYDPTSDKTEVYRYEKGRPNWISSDVVTRLYIDPQGIVWVSTWNGLNRLDPQTGLFRSFRADTSLNKELFSIEPDKEGNLWIGSRVGLVKFSTKTEEFEEFRHDPNDPTSISNNTVNNIFHTDDGHLWLATHNGLNRFDPKSGKSQAYFVKDGLPGNAISCILQDAGGNLWISTNHGVTKMNPKTGRFLNYNSSDGLPGDDMGGWHSCSAGGGGRMYFAGFPGAAVTDPSYVEKPDAPMPVAFTDIRIGDRPALYPLKPQHEAYQLAYNDSLAVTFAALDFANPASARYRYRLSGLDTDWHVVSSAQRTVNYAALPSGQFTLEVQAAAERGDWISKSQPLIVFVATPWWRSWWFYGLVAMAVLAVVTLIYQLRLRQLAAIYNMRLEERLGERTRVARDLHDTILQSFQGLTYRLEAIRNLLPEQPQRAADMLEVVLRKSDDAIIEGRETIQSLRDPANVTGDLISALNADARELASGQTGDTIANFNLSVDGEVEKFPPNVRHEIRQIVREAMRNAFMHAHATQIECVFSFQKNHAVIAVKDNGRGFGPDPVSVSGHFGLAGMRERATRIGADIKIDTMDGLGTKVELSITTNPIRLAEISRKLGGEDAKS